MPHFATTYACGNGFVIDPDEPDKRIWDDDCHLGWMRDSISEGIIYISFSGRSNKSRLMKLDTTKSLAIWEVELEHKSNEFFPRVFLRNVDIPNDALLAEYDGLVSRIDKSTGAVVWTREDSRVTNVLCFDYARWEDLWSKGLFVNKSNLSYGLFDNIILDGDSVEVHTKEKL